MSLVDEKYTWVDVFRTIFYFIGKKKWNFIFWTILLIISNFAALAGVFFIGKIVDFFTTFSQGDSLTPFYHYVIIIVAIAVFADFTRLRSKLKLDGLAIEAEYQVRTQGFNKLLDFSLFWHDKENSGNKVQRIQTGASALQTWVRMLYDGAIPAITIFVGVAGVFLFLNPVFFIFFIVYIALFSLIEWYFNRQLAKLNDLKNKSLESASGVFYESASNILSIKSLGAKKDVSKNVADKEAVQRDFKYAIRNKTNQKMMTYQVMASVGLGVFLVLLGYHLVAGLLTVGFILVYVAYYDKLREASLRSIFVITQMVEQKSNLKRMMPIFNEKAADWFGKKSFPKSWKSVNFIDVGFAYEDDRREFNLEKLNLNISKYEKIGVVGESGSGKSTLAKLFMGLYKINSGKITLGKQDLYDVSYDDLTKHVTIVLQESELFNMSVRDNITLLTAFDAKRFELAMDIAELNPLLKKLPKGIDTMLGEKGYKLSGGERQRIGIARAIYKNPEILILDEATSALDTKTEKNIQKKLESKLKKKTVISIAHRLSTLSGVDRIIVFDKGKIVEVGKFDELLSSDSRFKKLWEGQRH